MIRDTCGYQIVIISLDCNVRSILPSLLICSVQQRSRLQFQEMAAALSKSKPKSKPKSKSPPPDDEPPPDFSLLETPPPPRWYICVRRHKDLIYIRDINIFESDGMKNLKHEIHSIYNIAPSDQKLFYNGMLVSRETLGETGLEEEDFQMPHNPVVFHLAVREKPYKEFEPVKVADFAPLKNLTEYFETTDTNYVNA